MIFLDIHCCKILGNEDDGQYVHIIYANPWFATEKKGTSCFSIWITNNGKADET